MKFLSMALKLSKIADYFHDLENSNDWDINDAEVAVLPSEWEKGVIWKMVIRYFIGGFTHFTCNRFGVSFTYGFQFQ